jgi:hypothetical protein
VGRLIHRYLRGGVLPVAHELNRLDSSLGTKCPLCADADETQEHFVLTCPALADLRKDLLSYAESTLSRSSAVLDAVRSGGDAYMAVLLDAGPASWYR